MFFEEIIVFSLVKIDIDGNIIDEIKFFINLVGFIIYSVIYDVREDVKCVIYLYIDDGCVVVV